MTIYFNNFINQACRAASYVRDTARAHPTATKVAALSIAILSSYAIAKFINAEIPTPSTPVEHGNTFPPIPQPQATPVSQTIWEKIKEDTAALPSRISATGREYYKSMTSLKGNLGVLKNQLLDALVSRSR